MPLLSGVEVAKAIRAIINKNDRQSKSISLPKVVLVTGSENIEEEYGSLNQSQIFQHVIVKPISIK